MNARAGYTRLGGPEPRPDAVTWWYVEEITPDLVVARGGRVSTAREARAEIRDARDVANSERDRLERRPEAILGPGGDLLPLPYEPVRHVLR